MKASRTVIFLVLFLLVIAAIAVIGNQQVNTGAQLEENLSNDPIESVDDLNVSKNKAMSVEEFEATHKTQFEDPSPRSQTQSKSLSEALKNTDVQSLVRLADGSDKNNADVQVATKKIIKGHLIDQSTNKPDDNIRDLGEIFAEALSNMLGKDKNNSPASVAIGNYPAAFIRRHLGQRELPSLPASRGPVTEASEHFLVWDKYETTIKINDQGRAEIKTYDRRGNLLVSYSGNSYVAENGSLIVDGREAALSGPWRNRWSPDSFTIDSAGQVETIDDIHQERDGNASPLGTN